MSSLDYRLYEWLTEPDEQRFERAFRAYFRVAFPAVVRHLAKLSHWDACQLEDLAQEALLKFFDRVGRGRRTASHELAAVLPRIRPLRVGAAHDRLVSLWTERVAAFKDAAVGFRAVGPDETDGAGWRAVVRDLADHALDLQAQGCQLLGEVEIVLNAKAAGAPVADDWRAEVREFSACVRAVIEAIPQLRVPTNSYLFDIATSAYLDETKRMRRKKRGGPSVAVSFEDICSAPPAPLLGGFAHDCDAGIAGHEPTDYPVVTADDALNGVSLSSPAIDPARRCEQEDFYEKFYLYLRESLDAAVRSYEAARAAGRAPESQRRQVESLTKKFARAMSVLTLIGEGNSQEETAERLGLSRNQVRYIIESTQQAYSEFVAASLGSRLCSPEGEHHVR